MNYFDPIRLRTTNAEGARIHRAAGCPWSLAFGDQGDR